MTDKLVQVGAYWDLSEAHMAKAKLEDSNIQTFLENENSFTVAPHHGQNTGMKLLVKESDLNTAEEILKSNSE